MTRSGPDGAGPTSSLIATIQWLALVCGLLVLAILCLWGLKTNLVTAKMKVKAMIRQTLNG
jgi:hypothetical protein